MDTHSTKSLRRLSWLFLFAAITISVFSSCNKKRKLVRIDPEFSKYIEAYTSGVVSKKSTIRLQLAVDASNTHALNEPVKEELFSFSPSVKGSAYWVDARTIEFKPEKDLKPNELYDISFKLGKVLHVPQKFENFRFNVQITKPAFVVEENGLRANGKDQVSLSGQILTADVEESAKVEKLLSATLGSKDMKINWQHNESNKTHGFTINNVKREKTPGVLYLSWSGDAIDIKQSDKKELQIPAVGDFKVLDIKAVQDDEQYVLVQLSDPVKVGQLLEGLITINNQENLSYTILGSEVKVYAPNKLDGNYVVTVNEGIENQWGEKLSKSFTANLFFENRLPSVKIHGSGSILPNSGGKIVLPFDATNLKAVDVSVIKIFETNIAQFLQRNDLSGENELRRVAKPLVQATVRLDGDKTINLNHKNRFSLDLDKYIQTEPGAIYRITIGFRPEYSLYTCAVKPQATSQSNDDDGEYYEYYDDENNSGNGNDEDQAFWQRYDRWYPYGYNWQQKDDPCSNAYYNKERFESRNIISSNIGLTAKKGTNNSLLVAATDIITTDALDGVDLQVLDYQQQVVAKGSTNNDGIAILDLKRKPYLIIAKKGDEKGYLKIDDGSALSLSKFDVSGAEIRNGIKGFIFGERGVWRPGDSLYLGFIVEDKDKRLPPDHPIEMELYSPRGQLYKKMVATNSADGFNVFRTATSSEAPTGNWTCKMKIGGAVFEKTLKIETVMPNRLKIDLNFGALTALGKDAKVNGTLTAKWLFGATAQNLKARVDAQLYKKNTTFARFEDYEFDNPTATFSPQNKTIFDGALSADGTALINPSFDVNEQAPGMLLANLMVKVFEPGGNFSVDNISMPYHPYSSYAGVKVPKFDNYWGYLSTGKTHQFDIVDVNTEGIPTNGATNVEVELYEIHWKWWWDNSSNDLSNFTQDSYNKLLKKQTISLTNGRGSFSNKFNTDSWGRYLILIRDTRSGHVTGSTFYVDDDSWRSRRNDNDATSATMLSFTSDKSKYNVGEKVSLTIPSSEGGKAFISIETGSKVVKTYWVKTTKGQTNFSFTADKEMSPNIYVNVSLIQPHAQTLNDLPIRMYGVVPVMIEDKNTMLKPVIKMPDVIRPEKQTSITVSEASGKNMTYVIAIVDEGLLDLTRFKTPNPHDAFYAKEALGVKTWDLYDYVIGAWGGELERILSIGGDAEGDLASKTRKANRFKPVVEFMGPFKLNGGSKTHNFTLPAYMGSVRAMVIAASNGAYGATEKSVKVKSPLMILPTIPRVLGPTETVSIPVTVFATESNIRSVNISLEGNSLLQPVNKTVTANFKGTGEQTILLSAVVKSNTGIGNIKVVATSGKEKAVYQTEIDVRNPNPLTTQVKEFVLQPGHSLSSDVSMIGDIKSSKAVLELSSIPAINLEKRLSYLIQYPHGCIEQTTSSVFPQLVLNQLMQLTDRRKAEIDRNIRYGIQRIANFQQTDGGFSYWPGFYSEGSDDWGSNYAGHFLLEASSRGYIVPSNMINQWKAFQRKKALAWNVTEAPWYGSDLTQAYRLYLLALAKAPEIGAMNRLKEFKFLSPEAKWRLAAAYNLAGQNQIALQLISGLPVDLPARKDPGFTYGSDMRDEAMILETLTVMDRRTEAYSLLKTVAARLSQDNWYSTQTTAYSLIAIAKYSGVYNGDNKINASCSINNQSINVNAGSTVFQNDIAMPSGKGKVQLKNTGNNVLYVRVINEGKPVQGQAIVATNNPSVLQVGVTYLNSSGTPIDISQIKQGTDFIAKVTIKNPAGKTYNEMALSQIFPSGWEILNTRLYNNEGTFKSSASEYMDIRDDRVYHYFDIRSGETLTYFVQLNAAYLGKFYWPGVYAEAMYDHSISGGVSGKWIEVTQ
jgi:alpha-2-macroglobulin